MANQRVVFMGSPDFAVPILHSLAKGYSIAGVVTQPDRRAGRGRQMEQPPVKTAALELGVELIQPDRMKDEGVFETLIGWNPDVIVVAAFGKILRQNILDLPKHGCINVHASLLPRWRGAAPIQAAILNGDSETGVTIMKMDAGVDTGDVYSQRTETIRDDDHSQSLGERLSRLGADLLVDTLPGILSGPTTPIPQDESQATYAKILEKADGVLDFENDVSYLERQVRAYFGWPGTYTLYGEEIFKIHTATAIFDSDSLPGTHRVLHGKPAIGAKNGWLVLEVVQPAGKKKMSGEEYIRGTSGWLPGRKP